MVMRSIRKSSGGTSFITTFCGAVIFAGFVSSFSRTTTTRRPSFYPFRTLLHDEGVLSSRRRASPVGQDAAFTASSLSHHGEKGIVVALTREDGKNDKLRDQLISHPRLTDRITVKELPCIEHADGDDYPQLRPTLETGNFDYIAVTSPEAARVLASAWIKENTETNNDRPAVAAVGKATQETLEEFGISVAYCPTKATAETLAAELPLISEKTYQGLPTTILYPASSKAKTTLEKGLSQRGFAVTRLNTYDTVTAQWSESQQQDATHVNIACFASPSAVKGWLKNSQQNRQVLAACIGETSAQACREQEWPESHIFYPEKPGVSGWADAVADALENLSKIHN